MDTSIRLRLTQEEKNLFTEAAKSSGRTLSNWIRWVASQAANRTQPPPAATPGAELREKF